MDASHRRFLLRSCCAALAVLAAQLGPGSVSGHAADTAPPGEWRHKVDAQVLDRGRLGQTVEFLIVLRDRAQLQPAAALRNQRSKGRFVFEHLSRVAGESQQPLLRMLEGRGVEYRSYWVINMVWVRGDLALVETVARRNDVRRVAANPKVRGGLATIDQQATQPLQTMGPAKAVEWNILQVNADQVWALGFNGSGVVVGGQDTGYGWTHPALVQQYRGGVDAHDYHWYDAIRDPSFNPGVCGLASPEPCDAYGHGTHTMGTILGADGVTFQGGMAPGAKWIGCRNMDATGLGSPETYAACYQFFIAPTDRDGLHPNADLAPQVVNNSWSCPVSEGCELPGVLGEIVQSVRAAGIVTVHSAGNSGPSCSSVSTPAAIYEESFTVGATDIADAVVSFSSRGPVTIDGSGRRKPDVSAPGFNILSCMADGSYQAQSGTSMAAPHVAGLAALLLQAHPSLRGDVDAVEGLIEATARPLTTGEGCGGDLSTDVPNNVYGWGRIDALAACTAWAGVSGSVTIRPLSSQLSGSTVTAYRSADDVLQATVATHPDGLFQLDLPPGGYRLVAERPSFLSSELTNLQVAAGDRVVLPSLRLAGGDVDGDGDVDITDLSAMSAVFGGAEPAADLNGDGVVNIVDLAAAATAFGASAPTIWQ